MPAIVLAAEPPETSTRVHGPVEPLCRLEVDQGHGALLEAELNETAVLGGREHVDQR